MIELQEVPPPHRSSAAVAAATGVPTLSLWGEGDSRDKAATCTQSFSYSHLQIFPKKKVLLEFILQIMAYPNKIMEKQMIYYINAWKQVKDLKLLNLQNLASSAFQKTGDKCA